MKILKTLSKRGLALFLVLTMCLSLLPTTAMAAEMAEDHIHNEGGWSCERVKLICGMEEHHHDESCYPVNEPESDANAPENGSSEETEQTPDPGDVDTNEENQETEETQTPDDSQNNQETEGTQNSGKTEATENTEDSQNTEEDKNIFDAIGDFFGGLFDSITQTLSAVFEGDEPEETTCGKAEHTHTADCYEWHCTAPVKVQIPEDATEITPDKLTSAAYNRAMDMTAFFGLVQSSGVLGNNVAPASITFVGEDVDVTVKYEDAASSSAEIAVGEDAISYNGIPVAVYAQGEAEVNDGNGNLNIGGQESITLTPNDSTTITGSGDNGWYNHKWESDASTVASVSGTSATGTITAHSEGDAVITHTWIGKVTESENSEQITVHVIPATKYTVTFNAGDGTGTAYTTDPVSTLTAPKCSFTAPEGKQFKNWLAPDGKTYNVGDPVELSESLTLTAVYEDEPVGESYNLYCYTRIPGSATSDNANAMWNGMGVSTVSGVDAPSSSSIGARFDIGNPAIVAYPESYPDITHPTTKAVFKYAKDGSAEANMQGYYTIQWNTYVTVSNGANAGGNNHNSTVDSGTNTYHLDGAITLNESDYFTVNFMVQLPEASAFSAYDFENYSQRVAKDTAESSLKNPGTLANQTHTGVTYHFDGWYTDETCQTKATFNGTITKNTNYYGKYVRDTANYTVKHYQENLNGQYEEVTSDTETTSDTIGKEVSATAKTYPGFTCVEIEGKTVASGKILANGSLELKLYYTRNTYTVEYNLNGGTSEAALKYENQKYGVNTPKIANPTRTGYTFAAWSPAVADTVTGNATYVAQWTENREETKNLSYTVQYFKNGVADGAPATFTKSVWVNSTDTTLEVQKNSVNTSDYFGANYAFKKTEPATIPDTVNNGDVIKVYYLEKFTVTYTDGVDDKEIFANDVHDVKYGDSVPATKLTEQNLKRNDGYKFNGWSPAYDATAKVTENKTYTAQWVVDPDQTHEVSYTVEYYKDDVLQDNDTQTKKQNVQLLVNTLTVDKAKINTTNKYQGYKLNATAPATIPDTVTNGTVIKVYYVKDSFGYTVEYYFDNELDSSKTVGTGEKAEYGTSILTAAGITTIAEADVKHGTPEQNYALDRVENRNGTITDDANNNVVKIFYALDANDDDTPDKYQATVTYKVTGGYWNAASQDGVDKGPYVLTLKEKDTNGVWQNVSDMPSMQVPEASAMGAKDGYTATGAGWKDDKEPPATASVDMCGQPLVYEYVYPARSDLTYTVKYLECSTDGTPLDPSVKVYENATSGAYALGATVTLAEILTAHQATISGFEYHHASLSEGASLTISAPATGKNVVTLYYTRKSFEVTYAYDDTEPAGVSAAPSKQSHAYEADVTVADDPQTIPAGYTFNGWTTTDVTVTNSTFQMPADNVTFTGSFTANSYTIAFDKNAADATGTTAAMTGVKYDQEVSLTENGFDRPGYTFMGWAVASDKSTVAHADKAKVTNLTDVDDDTVTLYAVWQAKGDTPYTVKYFKETVDGRDYEEVEADRISKTGQTATEATAPAKSYDGFRETSNRAEGQYPDTGIITGDGKLVVARYYDRIKTCSYTVNYLEEGTNEVLYPKKQVIDQTFGASVTENPVPVAGYTSPAAQTITIGLNETVITFYYTKRSDLSYTINYYKDSVADGNKLGETVTVNGQTFGTEVSLSDEQLKDRAPKGYVELGAGEPAKLTIKESGNNFNVVYAKRTDLSYTVNYLENDTEKVLSQAKVVNGQEFGKSITEAAIDIEGYVKPETTSQTITIGVENNVINFYYTARTDLSYTVKYVDEDTNKELESDKDVPNQTFGAVVTEDAIAIEGYTVTSEATQSITIKVTGNEIVFTYSKDVISDPDKDTDPTTPGDGIPDKYQAVVVFESADETTGTVEGNTYQVFTFENNGSYVSSGKVDPEMVTYKGKGIYAFTHWTWSISTPLGGTAGEAEIPSDKTPVEMAKLLTVQGGTTITFKAYFAPEVYDVTVKYLLEGTNTELLSESPAQKTTFDAVTKTAAYDVTELVSNRITADRSEYAGKTFVRVDNTALTGTVTADTVINVYYALDVISDPGKDTDTDPDQPGDGIADKYQVVVKYVSADDSKGTVTGDNTTKVFTLGTAPNYVERDAITPGTAGVEPKANADAGYKFDGWQMDGRDISPDDLLNVEGGHEYTYTAKWAERDDLTYTVMYLEKGTNTPLHLADIVKNQKFGTVIQAADQKIEIDGYNYDSVSADTLKIGTGSNILYIYYTKRSDLSYTVNYLERGTEKILHEQKVVNNQAFDASVTEKAIDIDGYDKVAPAEQSIKIAVSGNKITFYYTKRTDLSYTVNYLEQGTDKVLHEQKVADNQTFETVINAATEVISIDNYQYVSASTDSIKIGIDESANVINLYYTQKTYTVRVSYKLTDDGKTFTAVQPLENGTSAAIGYPNGWTVSTADGADVVVPATIPQTKDGKTNNYVLDTALSEPMSGNAPKSGDDKAVVTVELVYSLDNMSDPSKDPDPANPGDGIPDDRQITVNFKAVNGTVNPASTVVTMVDANGNPAKDGTAKLAQAHIPSTRADTGFTGGTWDKAPAVGVEVSANETMTITYERIVNTITIEVVNGTASASSIYVLYGENSAPITFSGSEGYVLGSATVDGAPVELTNGMYTFYGVVKDHTIRVVYVQGTFTATFVDGQTGDTIETRSDLTNLPAESTYPAAPEHEGYDFTGWTVAGPDANGNYTITANYKPAEVEDETFTVIFTDGLTGETIEERPGIAEVPDEGAYPDAPEHEGYDFIGWTVTGPDADGNYSITANYVPVEIPVGTHTVTWVNWNGVQLQQVVVNDGDAEPDYTGAAPVRPSDTAYTYTFRGWSAPVVDADGNVTYTAQYTPSAIVPEGPDVPVGPTEPVTPPTPPTVIPDNPVPLAPPTTTITDQDVPLAGAIGLNDVDHFAYVIGYDDDTVRPLNNITRAEVATIFFRLMTDEYRTANWATTNDFSDVKAGSWYNNAISTCAKAGLLTGYPDGTFKPNQSITRAEFAAIAARFLSDEVTGENVGDFSDTANHWAAKEIRRAAEAGWVTGSNNEFRPNDKINRAEVMTIVNRMLDRIPDAEHMLETMKKWTDNPAGTWYYEAVQEATNEHAYERDELGVTETWTEILEARDWKALEAEWASANAR